MTIKEFSDKYQIPYNIAYKASYVVKPFETMKSDKEYNEQSLYNETLQYINARLKIIRMQCNMYETALNNMTNQL